MKIKKAEFFNIYSSEAAFPPEHYPEIALAGRSNVGKSSFLNVLTDQKKLARTSGTPGKTRAIHFYLINESFFIVDLPGYGYAQVSKTMKEKWAALLESYFTGRKSLVTIIQLVDIRHEPSKDDKQMAEWIRHFSIPSLVVATKADKIPRGKREKHRRMIASALELPPEDLLIFSAVTGEGKDWVLKSMARILEL